VVSRTIQNYAFQTYSALLCVTALVETKEKKEKKNEEAREREIKKSE
jgi:hypothetical protein